MSSARFNSIALGMLLVAAFVLRAWQPANMAIEHFDEGVYASNLFSDHLNFKYPDRQFYAPPLLPAIFEWVLIFSRANPHAVMWVNVVLGTLLVAAVFWTTKELLRVTGPASRGRNSEELARGAGDDVLTGSTLDSLANSAALGAAAIVAFSDIFIQYSRAALTDVPVCLWMTLAVGAGARAFRTGSWGWVLASGLVTSLAWWTKYNGWLPLAILGAGLAGWLLFTREGRASLTSSPSLEGGTSARKKKGTRPPVRSPRPGIRQMVQWVAIAAVAGLLWLPYLSELQISGGYAAIAANHKGYLVGWSGWGSSALRHLAVDRYYARWASTGGVLVATLLAWGAEPGPLFPPTDQKRHRQRFAVPLGLTIAGPGVVWMTGLIPVLIVAAVLVPVCWWAWKKQVGSAAGASLGLWILLAWIAGLTLTTPLYRPYPRLILPWMTAMAMGAGTGLALAVAVWKHDQLPTASGTDAAERGTVSRGGGKLLALAIGLAGAVAISLRTSPVFLAPRRGLLTAADGVLATIRADMLQQHQKSTLDNLDFVIYVLAEPGLYYHLASLEDQEFRYITQPASDLGMLTSGKIDSRVPAYLLTGPHSQQEAAKLKELPDRVRAVTMSSDFPKDAVWPYSPSDLVLLDEYPPDELAQHQSQGLQLWQIR